MEPLKILCIYKAYLEDTEDNARKIIWVNPLNSERLMLGQFNTLYECLCANPDIFEKFTSHKMIELIGKNLGERQQELNKKVYEAYINKDSYSLKQICELEEKSDIDRLYKIDLAILHKDLTYLEETLKCGDTLYISRVLKSSCFYDAQNIINPTYVHNNIFPYMSAKMKRKMLTAIAMHVQDQDRINSFYEYCKSIQLTGIAAKFLINTSQSYKEEYMNSVIDIDDSIKFELFFGTSYDLIEKYLNKKKDNFYSASDLHRFYYLYSHSSDKYLDMLEHYMDEQSNGHYRFGSRMSKDIIVKHRPRVFNRLRLYIGILNKKMIARHSSIEDIKKYATALLPGNSNEFWSMDFYKTYDYFLNKLPNSELYTFLKQIFSSKYGDQPFEMDISFYRLNYHKLMSPDQRHQWALEHIQHKKEHFGPQRDFCWLKFVKFDEAFIEMKKYIHVTKSANIRLDMINILVESASTQKDLETLLTYYYDRHVNEARHDKIDFIFNILDNHNVFQFNEKCWTSFYKLLHSIDAFTSGYNSEKCIFISAIYNIIHNKSIPDYLETCIYKIESSWCRKFLNKLDAGQKEAVYTNIVGHYVSKIKDLMEQKYTDDVKQKLILFASNVMILMNELEKPIEECPEVVMESMKLNWDQFHHWFCTEESEGNLLRLLKKDKALVIKHFENLKKYDIRCTNLLKKIRIYFYNDVAKIMTGFFEKKLSELNEENYFYSEVNTIIFNLIQLTDIKYKENLMIKYAPTSPKIKHDEKKLILRIQEAICSFIHYSRPPVPLSNVQLYIKGDYVPHCLPMFNSYLVNLPLPLSLQFIKSITDAPVSIQKHGLRLAFQCYDTDSLEQLVTNVWNGTRNVSLRLVMFKAVINKINKVNESEQVKLYEVLKMFTSTLGTNDLEEIYSLLTSLTLPQKFYGDFMMNAWMSVSKLSDDSSVHITRKYSLMNHIASYIELVDRTFCIDIIEDHMSTMFGRKHIIQHDDTYSISQLYNSKWKLTAKYITHYNNDEELESSLGMLNKIMKLCYDSWHVVYAEKYVIRDFLHNFLQTLKDNTNYKHDSQRKTYTNIIFENIVKFFKEFLPINKIYIFDYELAIICRNGVGDGLYDTENGVITYRHLIIDQVAKNLAKAIVEFIVIQYCPSLCYEIANLISKNLSIVTNWTDLQSDQLLTAVCRILSEYSQNEVHLLTLHLLPLYPSKESKNDFNATIDKIMMLNNEDLNVFMYHKFIYCDFINRLGSRM